jgi:hypothetical protein
LGTGHINQKALTVNITKLNEMQFIPWKYLKSCIFIKLKRLALKDDKYHCGSVMLRKWNEQHTCQPLTWIEMYGTFKLWCFARNNVHLIVVQKG